MAGEKFTPPKENFARGLRTIEIPELGEAISGKVRDMWEVGKFRVIATSDRVSAYDHVVGTIPGKGAVLNSLSAFWAEQTTDIVPNAVVAIPDPSVSIVRRATPLPVEVVVRGFMAKSSTETSVWYQYSRGERTIYGIDFPGGLRPNERLPMGAIVTPTTKADVGHDKPLTDEDARNEVGKKFDPKIWDDARRVALALFARGSQIALEGGLILVDTKYEMGIIDGELVLIDEIHTPDSSRFWLAESFEERFAAGETPDRFDKEILRAWLAEHGYTGEGQIPPIDPAVIDRMAAAYRRPYEMITGQTLPEVPSDAATIREAVLGALRGMGY